MKSKCSKNEKTANNRISIIISATIGWVFLLGLVVCSFFVPTFVNSILSVPDRVGIRNEITPLGKALVITDVYLMIVIAMIAVVFMLLLLSRVSKGRIFTKITGDIIRIVSICCFGEGILISLMILYFQAVICISLAAFFLGLCLMIVKNAIYEATRIKEENDFTV